MVTLGKIGGAEEQPLKKLSRREMDVLVMLAEGKSHQEVAELLAISHKTVASYKYRIHQKLNTRNTADITHKHLSGVRSMADKCLLN
jgi:DNA-binding NarL/FixJ family response regulator